MHLHDTFAAQSFGSDPSSKGENLNACTTEQPGHLLQILPPKEVDLNAVFPWSRFWTSLGMLLLFLCAVIIVLRWAPEPPNDDAERALLREKNLAELQKSNAERLGSYGWVDQAHGILHMPIARAMELETIALNAPEWRPHAVYAIAPNDLVPVPAGMPPSNVKSKE